MQDSNHVGIFKSITFSSRSVSNAVAAVVMGYLTFYCTDILAMPAGLVGALLLATKIFDGFTDLVAGFIVDKTHTKLGKARPYEVAIIGVWLSTWLMFSCPDLGLAGKSVWLFFTYTFANSIFVTILGATENVYYRRAFTTDAQRNKVISVSGILVTLMAVVVSVAFPIMMGTLGTSRGGWSTMVLLVAVPMAVFGMLRFIFNPEIVGVEDDKQEKLDFKAMLRGLKSGPYIYLIAGCALLNNILVQFSSGVSVYYFTYIVGNVELMSTINLLAIVTPFLLIFSPKLLTKISFSQFVILGSVIGIAGSAVRYVAGANLPLLVVGALLVTVASMPISYFSTSMIVSCMDYHEWKTGEKIEGIFSSINNFSGKIGSALASALLGVLMSWSHYDGNLEVQPDSANKMIVALYSWIPILLFIGIIILMRCYTLDKKLPQIRKELAERRGE